MKKYKENGIKIILFTVIVILFAIGFGVDCWPYDFICMLLAGGVLGNIINLINFKS